MLVEDGLPAAILDVWGDRLGRTSYTAWRDDPTGPTWAIRISPVQMSGPFVDVVFTAYQQYGTPDAPRYAASGGVISLLRTSEGWRVLRIVTGVT